MFAWFQRLLPKSGDFFGMFERHGAATLAAAEALGRLLRGEGDRLVHIQAIIRDHPAHRLLLNSVIFRGIIRQGTDFI